jgi:hypothetical protein
MSSLVSIKQQPVASRLHDALDHAAAYAAAIADNAIDDQHPIPLDLIVSTHAICNQIISKLYEAHYLSI